MIQPASPFYGSPAGGSPAKGTTYSNVDPNAVPMILDRQTMEEAARLVKDIQERRTRMEQLRWRVTELYGMQIATWQVLPLGAGVTA